MNSLRIDISPAEKIDERILSRIKMRANESLIDSACCIGVFHVYVQV